MKKVTVEQVLSLAAAELRKHGYKAENPTPGTGKSERRFEFSPEAPDGKLAFFVDEITPYLWLGSDDTGRGMDLVTIGVSYQHPGGGGNGFSKVYAIIPDGRDGYILMTVEAYNLAIMKYRKDAEFYEGSKK